ncbi:hypothetical protein PQ472_04395 [Lacticaseibacillus pabuli]|uniref:DUF2974 domain-containing protein n=1 Tax=Lacticaseibacillus pabuli TaxID=3025672 RepID=A0ABY7WWW7_9LACO|nr:hypothetical protein [Lacticaseibacillus sp. KACC 23028]WDF83481.1 hypothetical protein PQ472_04395 [Lacticaseibacillus sp. KACC 23028]
MLNSLRAGNYGNVYLDMSQSAYASQPLSFTKLQRQRPVRIDYSKARVHHGQQHIRLGRKGDPTVFLQPMQIGGKGAGDGLHAFVLTDIERMGEATHAYFVVCGTESMHLNDPDWQKNNIPFAFSHAVPAQTQAALASWRRIEAAYPNIKQWDFTGHSLGTMVIASMLADFNSAEAAKVGRVVLFNGPDVAQALDDAELDRIRAISARGQMDYYIGSRDYISAYNREVPSGIGKVHYIAAPLNTTARPTVNAHAFDQYVVAPDGTIALDETKANLTYAHDLARILDNFFSEAVVGKEAVGIQFARLRDQLKARFSSDNSVH